MRIKIKKGTEIEVKRFYLPIEEKTICPNCGSLITIDLMGNYLSYPTIGETEHIYLGCETCEKEYMLDCVLNMSVDIKLDTIREQ